MKVNKHDNVNNFKKINKEMFLVLLIIYKFKNYNLIVN